MLVILGLAAGVLALAFTLGQIQGRNPAFCAGAVGWGFSVVLAGGSCGLVATGLMQDASALQGERDAVKASEKELAAKKGAVPAGAAVPGTPKPGGRTAVVSTKGGGRKGSKRGGKKGGKNGSKTGGWGRRSRGPIVPMTPEREARIAALRKMGARFQARGGQGVRLQLAGPEITDKHLELVDGLSDTSAFHLHAPKVSVAALAPLATMTGLTELDMTGTPLNDESLVHLSGMTKLAELKLADQAITDKSAIVLAKLTDLKTLDLTNTKLTDKGVARLAGLKSLTRLVLSGTQVGDDGVGALVGITGLKQLEISHTQVTDAVVDHLLKFRNAELFWLTRGAEGVSDKAIARIRVDLRTCVVRFSAVELKGKLRDGAASGGE